MRLDTTAEYNSDTKVSFHILQKWKTTVHFYPQNRRRYPKPDTSKPSPTIYKSQICDRNAIRLVRQLKKSVNVIARTRIVTNSQ